eukprot:6492117-Amphidinium_carterae.3
MKSRQKGKGRCREQDEGGAETRMFPQVGAGNRLFPPNSWTHPERTSCSRHLPGNPTIILGWVSTNISYSW